MTNKKVDVALVVLSDTGMIPDQISIPRNDLIAIKSIIEHTGELTAELYNRDELDNARDARMLFVHFGGVVNFGGVQSKSVVDVIELINSFDGKVVIFSNDVMGGLDNEERIGFIRIERPVYYADPSGKPDLSKTKGLEIISSFEINQSFAIGKWLSQQMQLMVEPVYDAIYGGRARPKMKKRIQAVADNVELVTYSGISKEITGARVLYTDRLFNNNELRSINSLGRYSFMFHEPLKEYYTSRLFEQLFSTSIVLFDRDYRVLSDFWTDDNTFSGTSELVKKVQEPYSKERVHKQHAMAMSFDYDKYIHRQCAELVAVLDG